MNAPETQKAIDKICADWRTQVRVQRKNALLYAIAMAALAVVLSFGQVPFLRSLCVLTVFFYMWYENTREWVKPLLEKISEIENEPTTADAYEERAHTFFWDGHHEAAEIDCRKSFELNPDCDRRIIFFAFILHNNGKDDEALQALEPLLKNEGDYQARAYANKADILKKDDPQAALDSLAEAIRSAPDNEDFYLCRADILIDLERFEEAKKDLDAAEKLTESHRFRTDEIHSLRATWFLKQNELQNALSELNRAIEIMMPFNPELLQRRAALHDKLGNYAQAEQDRMRSANISGRSQT